MKSLPWILVCLLLGMIVWMRCNPHDPSTVYIKGDTVHIRDTLRDTILQPVKETLKRIDTVYLPILIDITTDRTVEGDSIPVLVPITSKEYKTDDYRAVVSGYKPSLDSMEIYRGMRSDSSGSRGIRRTRLGFMRQAASICSTAK